MEHGAAFMLYEMQCHCLKMVYLKMDNRFHHPVNEFSAELNENKTAL